MRWLIVVASVAAAVAAVARFRGRAPRSAYGRRGPRTGLWRDDACLMPVVGPIIDGP